MLSQAGQVWAAGGGHNRAGRGVIEVSAAAKRGTISTSRAARAGDGWPRSRQPAGMPTLDGE
jgi:hypothetical protein